MNLTAREEYGLRALMHLASRESEWPVQSREIARTEGIPEQFLEQVLAGLRRSGIVRSIRGAAGGYELARPAREITAGDVLRALSGSIGSIQCQQDSATDRCDKLDSCVVLELWQRVQSAVTHVLDGTTILDLVEEKARREQDCSFMMNI